MWSPATRNTTLALACATLATFAAFQGVSRLVQWRLAQQYRLTASRPKRELRRASLRAFQSSNTPWVAVCGTAFDVTGDPFFDARSGGIYASWIHRDVTALLVYGGVIEGRPIGESEQTLLGMEVERKDIDGVSDELAVRRRQIAAEWYARFHSRYEAVGQLTDQYADDEWESLRVQFTPPEDVGDDGSGKPRRRGKCPLGFGASIVEAQEVELEEGEDADSLREIRFQGKRYDVRGSALFASPHGPLAAFVGHDITYALATQSNNVEDLDADPGREYTYEEQLRLEQFRRIFAKELRVISTPGESNVETKVVTQTVDLHRLIDEDAAIEEFQRALSDANAADAVHAVCMRTTMTPLHKAVEKNRKELVELLIQAGADVEAPAALYDDETALQMAQRFGYSEIVETLTKANV